MTSGQPGVWACTTRARWAPWLIGAGAWVFAVLIAVLLRTPDESPVQRAALVLTAIGGLAVLTAAGVTFSSVTVLIDALGITLRYGPLHWPRQHLSWTDVSSVAHTSVRPWQWGGWGYRWRPGHGTAVVMRGGSGIEITRGNGRVLVISTDDAEGAVSAARQWG
ncbi:MAG: hypothetical protein KGP10_02255 [Actinomycetales bacterium]|nr:hypothetical protein [Actinomycetales bacterium]